MVVDVWLFIAVTALGIFQYVFSCQLPNLKQVHRNFWETYGFVAAPFVVLLVFDGFGDTSFKSMIAYTFGRLLYTFLSVLNLTKFRKWAWAISMIGVVGMIIALIQHFL